MDSKGYPSPTDTVRQMGTISLEGNIIPHNWRRHLRLASGKVNLCALYILAEIVYWYRPIKTVNEQGVEEWRKRFKADKLQKSYDQLVDSTGLTREQVKNACYFLRDKNLIDLETRTVEIPQCGKVGGIMFIGINPLEVRRITFEGVAMSPDTGGVSPDTGGVSPDTPPGVYRHEGCGLDTPHTEITPEITPEITTKHERVGTRDAKGKTSTGKAKKPKREPATEIYASIQHLDDFNLRWSRYVAFHKKYKSLINIESAGDKAESAKHFRDLVEQSPRGYEAELERFDRGLNLSFRSYEGKAKRGEKLSTFVSFQYYVGGKEGHTTPYWESALDEEEAVTQAQNSFTVQHSDDRKDPHPQTPAPAASLASSQAETPATPEETAAFLRAMPFEELLKRGKRGSA